MRVAVLGARGQLGAAVVHEFSPHHDVTPFDRAALDITNGDAVRAALGHAAPDVIINCAAYNAVDAAEDHPVDALQNNAFAVRTLARAAVEFGAVLVHYSSDFVFDGTAQEPYGEEARPNPRSVYAASKLLGEWFAREVPRHYVLRVESLFGETPAGPSAKGTVGGILKTLIAGGTPKVFEDRTVSPTFVIDGARATRHLIERVVPSGLYHCVNSGFVTWLDLARVMTRQLGMDEGRLIPVRMADVPLPAVRPQYCALSNAKLASAGFMMPTWQDALGRYLDSIRHDLAHKATNRKA